ncbi:polysaccharide deacetylase family protein [Pseudidiomarina insulisalsae]|uniref:NodB homology domain-containing protein n=1 Tax=Pseudidiomarina insulisalsae TaxID=575789 RepID=A0A432YAC2_9GAMM|nr:polysaccharide deacetylase family protein [Pseudidiomarina insulisalsae]RUO57930.1 hypothetical protein CWI71_11010 [Pseudidiomarina insulisalsae]
MWPNGFLNITTRGASSEPRVYLTFDDGPDPRFTPPLLDLLAEYEIRASFFVLGEACKAYPKHIRQLAEGGHDIGIHSYTHDHPWRLSAAEARAELQRCYHTLADITGSPPTLFRPAYGRFRPATLQEAKALQLTTVLWNRSVVDWGRWGTLAGISRRLNAVKPGDIVLMHDARPDANRPENSQIALREFLRSDKATRLSFSGLSQLIKKPS